GGLRGRRGRHSPPRLSDSGPGPEGRRGHLRNDGAFGQEGDRNRVCSDRAGGGGFCAPGGNSQPAGSGHSGQDAVLETALKHKIKERTQWPTILTTSNTPRSTSGRGPRASRW